MKTYPEVQSFREEVANTDPKIREQVREDMMRDILDELDHLTEVHIFDMKDKKTWPKEGEFFVAADRFGEIDCYKRWGEYILFQSHFRPEKMDKDELNGSQQAREIVAWSYSTPPLQVHIKQ